MLEKQNMFLNLKKSVLLPKRRLLFALSFCVSVFFSPVLFASLDVKTDEVRVDQGVLLEKIRIYLRSNNEDEDFIKQFTHGHCVGISAVWLHAKWLQTQPKAQNIERDDYDWFKSTVELIANWDEITPLTEKESADFERFILLIRYSQIGQVKWDKNLESAKQITPKKEYSLASLFTLRQLRRLLQIENIIQDGRLIFITSHNHATALFKEDGIYYYYLDPDCTVGEIQTTETDDVAKLIFDANFDSSYNEPSPLTFQMFSFDETAAPYPTTHDALVESKGHDDEYSRLLLAAQMGGLKFVRYFLIRSDPNMQAKDGKTALILAAANGHDEIVELLLEKGADPNIEDNSGKTAFMYASENDHVECVTILKNHQNHGYKDEL